MARSKLAHSPAGACLCGLYDGWDTQEEEDQASTTTMMMTNESSMDGGVLLVVFSDLPFASISIK